MKPWTLVCAASLPLLFTVAASAATNRTTRLGQVDSEADSSFLHLIDASVAERASRLPVVSRTAGQYFDHAPVAAEDSPAGDNFGSYLMLGLAGGLVAVHLRRKQKSLQHRPLAEVMYR